MTTAIEELKGISEGPGEMEASWRRRVMTPFLLFKIGILLPFLAGCGLSISSESLDAYFQSDDTERDYDGDDGGFPSDWDQHIDESGCYPESSDGCSFLSWAEVEASVDSMFLTDDSYNGYDQKSALTLARTVYDNGTYPRSRLAIIAKRYLGNGRYRAFVSATRDDGSPLEGLSVDDFTIQLDANRQREPIKAMRFADLKSAEMRVGLSAIIDDSGSVQDCDAMQISNGLEYLLGNLPDVYQAELIKFETDVYRAHEFTKNGDAIVQRMVSYCTDRGSTSLWDAVDLGMRDNLSGADLKILVVFSDGVDNSSSIQIGEISANIRQTSTPVFSIALGLADIFNLWSLSSVTGGAFVYIHNGSDIIKAFGQITEYINEIYIIEWTSAIPFETVTISVEDKSSGANLKDTE